jgi:hypothetical protein
MGLTIGSSSVVTGIAQRTLELVDQVVALVEQTLELAEQLVEQTLELAEQLVEQTQ